MGTTHSHPTSRAYPLICRHIMDGKSSARARTITSAMAAIHDITRIRTASNDRVICEPQQKASINPWCGRVRTESSTNLQRHGCCHKVLTVEIKQAQQQHLRFISHGSPPQVGCSILVRYGQRHGQHARKHMLDERERVERSVGKRRALEGE